MGKNFDCSGGFCPLMVTADELPARKPNPIWMKPGDVCEIEGVLRNPDPTNLDIEFAKVPLSQTCAVEAGREVQGQGLEEDLEMTTTVLLMTILTGINHTVVAEYDTPQACEAAAQAHQKVLLGSSITMVYSCSPKAGSR